MSNDNFQPNISINNVEGDFVTGDKKTEVKRDYINNQINYYSVNSDVGDLAKELDELLQSLEEALPDTTSESSKEIVKNNALHEIEKKPLLKEKLLAAIKAGSIKAVEEFCKHPLASVLLAAFKAAFPDEKKA